MGDCCTLISMTGLIVMTGFYVYCGIQCFIKPYIKEEIEIEHNRNNNVELQNLSKEKQPLLTTTINSQPYKT